MTPIKIGLAACGGLVTVYGAVDAVDRMVLSPAIAAEERRIDARIDLKMAGMTAEVEELKQKVSTEGSKTRVEVYGVQNELTKLQSDLENQGKDIDRAVQTIDKIYQHLLK